MDNRIRGLIGLVGGVIALVGVLTPWITFSINMPGIGEMSESRSAWRFIAEPVAATRWESGCATTYSFLALVGSSFVIMGALYTLAGLKMRIFWAILAIGGVLAMVGAVWGFLGIDTYSYRMAGNGQSISLSYGYGLYLTLVGSIIGIISNPGFEKLLHITSHKA